MRALKMFLTLWGMLLLTPFMARAQKSCEALRAIPLPGATIEAAAVVPPSAAAAASIPGTALRPQTQAYCRVAGYASPSPDSHIGFEVWMPIDGWNGELLQVGNGGLAGSIVESAMAQGIAQHFAVAGTDDGHKGTGTDGSWAIGHPEKVIDFGYRAVHQTSILSRLLVKEFYGHTQRFAFFSGCSEGGREAMMEAQRYPEDFNGILAGSPAGAWTGLMTAFAWNAQALFKNAASSISPKKLEAIEAEVLKQCGTQGGFTDPFVKDPLSCHFDPSVLQCKSADSDSCLTPAQFVALKSVYSGPMDARTGHQVYPGYEPGAEAEPGTPGISYASYIYGSPQAPSLDLLFSSAFYGSAVVGIPGYSSLSFDFEKDTLLMKQKVASVLDATNPDLRAFKAHGGKLLHYHGWYDGSPAPQSSIDYYRAVTATMGGLDTTQKFYRLFMAPGMMHCGQGPGPNSFGNLTDSSGKMDPEHNIFSALRSWVEEGRKPDSVIATKYPGDDPGKPPLMTRPLCPFPQQATWQGKGSTADAANFRCLGSNWQR